MRKKIELIPSGISFIDDSWGGLYRGGTYLLVGPRKSGRTLLGLQFAMECVRQKEVCLYFTTMRPKDLMIQAASIDFDLQSYMSQNLMILVRVSPPVEFEEASSSDEFLAEYISDIVTLVDQYEPNKIVFDELTPFIGFRNTKILENTFIDTTEAIEDGGITSLFIIGDPATQAAKEIVDTLTNSATGMAYLQKKENGSGTGYGGKISLIPNIGHTQGQFTSVYSIEPNKGMTFKSAKSRINAGSSKKYKTLAELDLPETNTAYTNIYSYNDFILILNNQIALFKSTGQPFTLLAFKIRQEAEGNILTISQLQNAVRLATDKKEKICVYNKNVLVLVTKEDVNGITAIFARVKGNLPSVEQSRKNPAEYISIYSVKVSESIQNAEELIHSVMINGSVETSSAW